MNSFILISLSVKNENKKIEKIRFIYFLFSIANLILLVEDKNIFQNYDETERTRFYFSVVIAILFVEDGNVFQKDIHYRQRLTSAKEQYLAEVRATERKSTTMVCSRLDNGTFFHLSVEIRDSFCIKNIHDLRLCLHFHSYLNFFTL